MEEYKEKLYDKNGEPKYGDMELEVEDEVGDNDKGPGLLDSEIRKAIQEMKIGKYDHIKYQLNFGKCWETMEQ